MPPYQEVISPIPALLPHRDLQGMIRLVRTLYRLSAHPAYRELVLPQVPEAARRDPGHDAVMMGYDFHLGPEGPRLIEVNTNAGGSLPALMALQQKGESDRYASEDKFRSRFLGPFAEEMSRFSAGRKNKPALIAIIDENPREQFLFGEMEYFAGLFKGWGAETLILDPSQLDAGPQGVFHQGREVDLIYNRHCDFYLEEPVTAGIREAYLAGSVCLTPHPFAYGLLGDKRRMILWSDREVLGGLGLEPAVIERLTTLVPESRLLAQMDAEPLWRDRNNWIFKPVDRFGSRGVLAGRKISRSRFNELPVEQTLVQRMVPPSVTETGGDEGAMKTDFRLYVYRNRVLGLASRLYQGQVTNLRTPGGGFAAVKII